MPNPYHDEQGRFCSANEMKSAFERLAETGDHDGYFKLRTEYEALRKENAPFEITPTLKKRDTAPIQVERSLLQPPAVYGNIYQIEYDYNGRYTPEGESDDDGYGRNSVYSNLHLVEDQEISARSVLSSIFNTREENIPDDLVSFAEEGLQMNTLEAYELETSRGYYGEEASVHLSYEVKNQLMNWYYQNEGAWDSDGVLDYVRGKGTATQNLSPVQALKAQLSAEYRGKLPTAVKNATSVKTQKIALKDIKVIDTNRLTRTAGEEIVSPVPAVKGSVEGKLFAGVVVQDKTGYVLVDGYARHKTLKDSGTRGMKEYIVLGNDYRYGGRY